MYVLFLPLSFLIPSSSGLATVAMPIMAPLASFAERSRVPGGDRLPDRQRTAQPGHPDLGGRHGRTGHRPRRLRHVAALRMAHAVLLAVLSVLVVLSAVAFQCHDRSHPTEEVTQ